MENAVDSVVWVYEKCFFEVTLARNKKELRNYHIYHITSVLSPDVTAARFMLLLIFSLQNARDWKLCHARLNLESL